MAQPTHLFHRLKNSEVIIIVYLTTVYLQINDISLEIATLWLLVSFFAFSHLVLIFLYTYRPTDPILSRFSSCQVEVA